MRRLVVVLLALGLLGAFGGIWVFNQNKPSQLTYRCKGLNVSTTDSPRVFRFTTTVEAAGAKPVSARFIFGDGVVEWITWPLRGPNGEATKMSYSHIYLAPANYIAEVQVKFRIKGARPIATSSQCRQVVKVV